MVQRLRAFYEEPYSSYPNEELKAGCLALYEAEKAQGTELPAIIGALQEYIELEEERLIPSPIDQNPCAHWRNPMDMIRQGWSTSLFHASQQ